MFFDEPTLPPLMANDHVSKDPRESGAEEANDQRGDQSWEGDLLTQGKKAETSSECGLDGYKKFQPSLGGFNCRDRQRHELFAVHLVALEVLRGQALIICHERESPRRQTDPR